MRFYEVIVIYLSIGAPFAVLTFLRARRKPLGIRVFGTVVTLFLWLPEIIYRRLRSSNAERSTSAAKISDSFDADVNHLVRNLLDRVHSNSKFSEFREKLERYATLSSECFSSDQKTSGPEKEFLRIAGNDNVHIGSACLKRANFRKMLRHQEQAASDLIGFFINAERDATADPFLGRSVIELCHLLNDPRTAELLERQITGSRRRTEEILAGSVPDIDRLQETAALY